MGLDGLLKAIEEYNEKYAVTEDSTYAEKLRYKIMDDRSMTKQDYLDLQKEVDDFMRSDASEEDKKMLRGYTETLYMICSAIKEKKL